MVLFHDTFVTYNAPEIGRAAVELLEAAGYGVELVDKKCCGRPAHLQGHARRGEVPRRVERDAARSRWVARGVPIVGLEPSCLLTLRDEYVDLLRTDEARQVARRELPPRGVPAARAGARARVSRSRTGARRALLHGHCHQKALVGTAPTVAALTWAGFEVTEVDSGLLRHGRLLRLREGALRHLGDASATGASRPRCKGRAAETEVVAPGISCRQQIQHLTGRRAKHPAEALRESLAAV